MADSTLAITEGTGKLLDTEQVTVGGSAVQRQRIEVAGSTAGAIATVTNAAPTLSDYGVTVRMPGPVGQTFGTVVTHEVNAIYISGKSRVPILTTVSNAAVTAATGIPLVAGSVGKATYLMHITVAASAATQIYLRDNNVAGGVLYLAFCAAGGSSVTLAAPSGLPIALTSINNGFWLDCSANATIYISVGTVQA